MGAPGTTPGVWAVSKQKPRRVTAGGVLICNAVLRNQGGGNSKKAARDGKDEAEAIANALMLAASKAMYDILNQCADYLRNHPDNKEARATVLASIDGVLGMARGEGE